MKYNISKELFEAVMGYKVVSITINDYIFFEMKDGYKPDYGISVDTFFFKCKEWALGQGYKLQSSPIGIEYVCIFNSNGLTGNYFENFRGDSEQQSVFDATQWILENKEK